MMNYILWNNLKWSKYLEKGKGHFYAVFTRFWIFKWSNIYLHLTDPDSTAYLLLKTWFHKLLPKKLALMQELFKKLILKSRSVSST